jgi:signal transduction histidine kinase
LGARLGGQPRTRLGDFTFSGRTGPIAALLIVSAAIFFMDGYSASLRLLLQLCSAYTVPFLLLACLARIRGANAPWRLIVPTAAVGIGLGAFASAAVAVAPEWGALARWSRIAADSEIGAAFSAFFVGLSLVTSAVRQSEQAEFETQRRLLEARLKMLSARIEPHFLMNTLANLRYLVKSDAVAAYEMLDHLSEFLRGALERSRDLKSTLGQELQTIQSYLKIMQIRMGDKLRFEIDVPEGCRSVPMPALLLQTLVENAVAHGIDPGERPGCISIRATDEGSCIRISVVDDGIGFDPEKMVPGNGLRNVQDRLETFFAGDASFSISSLVNGGTEATVMIPRGVA